MYRLWFLCHHRCVVVSSVSDGAVCAVVLVDVNTRRYRTLFAASEQPADMTRIYSTERDAMRYMNTSNIRCVCTAPTAECVAWQPRLLAMNLIPLAIERLLQSLCTAVVGGVGRVVRPDTRTHGRTHGRTQSNTAGRRLKQLSTSDAAGDGRCCEESTTGSCCGVVVWLAVLTCSWPPSV